THDLLQTIAAERPFAVQLFGNNAELMGRAAAIVSGLPVDLIDINMGCPVRKVVKKGCGAALMKNLLLAETIIRAVCSCTRLPVTVKFRSGWTESTINAPEFAAMAETSGAAAVIVHGRTWEQGFGGRADWEVIRKVKQAVTIPVIGNGDVRSFADGLTMMQSTACDGVMVGRAALGNPWLFAGTEKPPSLTARLPLIRRYVELAQQFLPVNRVLFKVKLQVVKFLAGLPGAARLRPAVIDCKNIEELTGLLNRMAGQ
ncbi:MAG: tRNA dihydrouridine synthase DusB, partial [Desulfobulbus sp.]|nr:tRNA dihydrouridine synthase DusB [Desulfobulbus sp.]